MFAQGGEEGEECKPTVHQEVVGPDAQRQYPFHHGFQVLSGFGHGLQPELVATATLVHLFPDPLQSLARLDRGTEDEIKRQEAHPVRPAQGHGLKPFQAPVGVVVMHPGEQFNHLGAGPVTGAVVDDQHLSRCSLVSTSMNRTTTVAKPSNNFRQLYRGFFKNS